MNTLVCLSGLDTGEFLRLALPQVNPATHLALLYVVDTRPTEELGYLHRRQFFGTAKGERETKMESVDRDLGQHVLSEAITHCVALGFDAQTIVTQLKRGRPEHEIISTANELRPDLLIIGARYKGGAPVPTGPASIGPVARYVIDHAACSLLVVK